jgi:ATP-dependent RNA helicase RhlE
MTNTVSKTGFTGLGIAPRLLDVIDRLKFTEPTPIQRQSIPSGIDGKDLIAIAQTGTGKTLAFGIPMIQRLAGLKGNGLVILPTRELALQVEEALRPFGTALGMKMAVLIGGASMNTQHRALEKKPRIIIATPGRLLDHMDQRTVNLSSTVVLVLDEADRMLDMGFAPQINKILMAVPRDRQTMLFSATMPTEIVAIAKRHMELPINVEIAPSGTTSDNVTHEVFFIAKEAKSRLLEVMLNRHPGPVLVFTRTKHGARKLTRQVKAMKFSAAEIHSDRSLAQRREALEGFKSGKYRVLVATDIAARGIDVTGIESVINFDLPSVSEDYVHRIGRTARAGRNGRAISFATFDQRGDIWRIEKLIRSQLPVSKVPDLPPDPFAVNMPQRSSQSTPQRSTQSNQSNQSGQTHGGRSKKPWSRFQRKSVKR